MVATLRGALQEVHEKCARYDAQRPGARRKRSIPTRVYRRLRWLGITRHLGGEQSPPILPAPDARVVSYPWMDIESLSLERHLHDQAPSRAAYEAWMDSTAMCYDSDNKLYVPVATSIMQYASTAYNNAATVYHYNQTTRDAWLGCADTGIDRRHIQSYFTARPPTCRGVPLDQGAMHGIQIPQRYHLKVDHVSGATNESAILYSPSGPECGEPINEALLRTALRTTTSQERDNIRTSSVYKLLLKLPGRLKQAGQVETQVPHQVL